MNKRIISLLIIITILLGNLGNIFFYKVNAAESAYTTLRNVDKGSFNEYRYKITKGFFKLKETFEVDYVINTTVAKQMLLDADEGFKYLPDNLKNDLKYNRLTIALKKAIKYPNNEVYFSGIAKALKGFLENPVVNNITGTIIATPLEGNAPLITTLRANVEDSTGTKISKNAYVWWIFENGKRKIIGNKSSISKTFKNEGNYTVFLDVKSSHKNSKGYTDVLPFSSSVKIKVKEKIASIIFRISGKTLDNDDTIKFSPEIANYGLIFDATSSVPTSGTKFVQTSWDFGNGVTKSYKGNPRIERVIYSKEGTYDAFLELKTNTGKVIKKSFKILVHKPIASIRSNLTEGFMGDKFTFRAENHGGNNLSYLWEIININKDKEIIKKSGSLFTYSFKEKGTYSVKLKIKDAAGNVGIDTKTIYINSRAPIANFTASIPNSNKPNRIFLNATSSFDLDHNDDGNLKYFWTINGQKVYLEEPNSNGSTGFYTVSSIGDHSVILEVKDLDGISSIKKSSVNVKSTLSLDFRILPKVGHINSSIQFIADSPEAEFYTWNFGNGIIKSQSSNKITHQFNKSGIFKVTLTVDGKGNKRNSYTQNVYIGDSKNPVSVIDISRGTGFEFIKKSNSCFGKEAYLINRKDNIIFSAKESININGNNNGLLYSWKIGDKYKKAQTINYRFDELGCYNIKLTVKSEKNKTTDVSNIWVKVENIKPSISSLRIMPVDLNTDPVVVKVSAIGAKDEDGIIQSYIWYYTTDIDSEAQDFRITKGPETTFVIPKIQGTYYFGVVMKDNNGAKVNSEDLVNKIGNNFIELQGDNTNTPLIDFSTSDSSISIGEEVTFRAIAKNIRGDSIEKTSDFFWDFDGDGFYEKETKTSIVTYIYKKSGTFYPKVKVKSKGFSNTRTLTISVSNKLISDFKYVSIGDKFIFIDKSKGTIDKKYWDLGDGTIKKNKDNFIHNYNNKKKFHTVQLSVSEGTKVKKITKDVQKNIKNILKSRKKGLNVFSFPETNSSGSIILEEEEEVFIYLGESKGDFTNFAIDYNILKDSDLNGGKDDDIDNLKNSSYNTGSPEQIILNKNRIQTIRLFLIDENSNIIESKDIKIVKKYIEEVKEIKSEDLKFSGVSIGIKTKIEKLKILITSLSQENRMKGMLYLQKMQENWLDKTEKVRTIIEFEGFLQTTNNEKAREMMDILESLLVDGEDDKSEKNISFIALKALIPDNIECEVKTGTCKNKLTEQLALIKDSFDIEENRKIGKQILLAISRDKEMNAKQKNDFKAILKVLVYSGINNIPKEEKEKVIEKNKIETGDEKSKSGTLMIFLKKIGWIFLIILGIIIVVMFVFWILDFIKNRKSGESFENFVDNKKSEKDPLSLSNTEEVKEIKKVQSIEEDNIGFSLDINEQPTKKEEDNIPDWLKGDTNEKEIKEPKKEIKKVEPEKVEEKKVEEKKIEEKKVEEDFNLEKETQIEEDNIPDWLKGETNEKEIKEPKKEIKKVEPEKVEPEKVEPEKVEEKKIEKKKVEEEPKKEVEKEIVLNKKKLLDKEDIPDWLKESVKKETNTDKKENSKKENNKKDELWNDGMTVPDWLKND